MGEDRGDDRDRNALRLMKIQRSRIVHVAQGKPSILIHLLFFFKARDVLTDRVDLGPRDFHRSDPIRRPPSRHVTSNKQNRVGT